MLFAPISRDTPITRRRLEATARDLDVVSRSRRTDRGRFGISYNHDSLRNLLGFVQPKWPKRAENLSTRLWHFRYSDIFREPNGRYWAGHCINQASSSSFFCLHLNNDLVTPPAFPCSTYLAPITPPSILADHLARPRRLVLYAYVLGSRCSLRCSFLYLFAVGRCRIKTGGHK